MRDNPEILAFSWGSAASLFIAESSTEIPELSRGRVSQALAEIASGNQKSHLWLSEGELSIKCFIQNLWNSGDSAWDPQGG